MTATDSQLFKVDPPQRVPHTLTVVEGVQRPGADGTDEPGRVYTVTCPGVAAGRCAAWNECSPCTERARGDERFQIAMEDDEDHVQHEQEHIDWDGAWCIATRDCWVATHPGLIEACLDAGLTDVGIHMVEWESDDVFLVLRPVEATR